MLVNYSSELEIKLHKQLFFNVQVRFSRHFQEPLSDAGRNRFGWQ
jgi:hypothetical protein